MREIILGIDLGTTYSVCATIDSKEPLIISSQEGQNKTPSIVAFKSAEEILVGELAKRQSAINPNNTVFSIKRFIGKKYSEIKPFISHFPFNVKSGENDEIIIETDFAQYTPEQISSLILSKIKKDTESFLGQEVEKVIVTVPAYFNNLQREKTKNAAEMAGFEVLRLINEPTAAALSYSYKYQGSEVIAVYDLGGGTFDLTILKISESTCEVLATGGDTFLGGDDIDKAILTIVARDFQEKTGYDLLKNHNALVRLKEACEQAKCEMNQLSETEITLPFIASQDNNPLHLNYKLQSTTFNELVKPFIQKTLDITSEVISSANITVNDIDKIILAGGSTRLSLVVDMIEGFFKKKPFRGMNPDEVVAIGAVIQAGILTGSLQEILLLDVTPVSLGVETIDDHFSVLIENNSTIPTQKTKIFTTTQDNQALVPIHILQGKNQSASQNISLGYYTLSGFPPLKKGEPRIEVTFSIDADGILEVVAREKKSGASLKVNLSPTFDKSQYENNPQATEAYNVDNKGFSQIQTPPPNTVNKTTQIKEKTLIYDKELLSPDKEISQRENSIKPPFNKEKTNKPEIKVKDPFLDKTFTKSSSFYNGTELQYKTVAQLESSAELLEKAYQLNKKDEAVINKLINTYKQMIKENSRSHDVKMKLAKLYYYNNKVDSAITYFQQAILNPDYLQEGSKYLGMSFFEKKLYYIALQQFKKCHLDEEIKKNLYELSQAFVREAQNQNALYALEYILSEDINYKDAMQQYHKIKILVQEENTQPDDIINNSMSSKSSSSKESFTSSFLGSRFTNLKEINRGSMGIVYLAFDTSLEENVVLKILTDTLARDPKALKRFKREAKATRRLSHPNIVRIYDFGEINGIKYISMEYIDGKDMKKLLRTHGRFSEKKVLYYARQICSALQCAHEAGIIHRDIKPANILLSQEDIVKISDFGIAKSTQSTTEVTKFGEIVGTPLYMSPEQIKSYQIDFRADIYSLGIVLYEMISGKPPFIEGDITFHHLNTTPVPPKYCSKELGAIIMKCLQKRLEIRYQSVLEVLNDIMKFAK